MQQEFDTFDVLGIPISVVNLDTASDAIVKWKHDRRARAVGVREVASIMAMRSDTSLLRVAQQTAMNLPDGMPVVWLGKLAGHPVERACGPDLMERVILESPHTGLRHFFYGGKNGIATIMADNFRKRAPGVEIVGTYCPPFRRQTEKEDNEVVEIILASGADVLWVGLSSPQQDIWMDEHLDCLPITMIGVGAAFDYHSGAINRAPVWMQQIGMEWLHRLISEPKRLWRRYLVLAPLFVGFILIDQLSRRVCRRRS